MIKALIALTAAGATAVVVGRSLATPGGTLNGVASKVLSSDAIGSDGKIGAAVFIVPAITFGVVGGIVYGVLK